METNLNAKARAQDDGIHTPFSHMRTELIQALFYLNKQRHLAPETALQWIMEEARAKRALLVDVALSVIHDQDTPYHHNVPV